MFMDQPLQTYLDKAASHDPTPGGGSVAALAGALGTCMGSMSANFTVGKKKYADVEDEVRAILDRLAACREALVKAMTDDAVAFDAVGAAYGMPKGSDEEKAARTEAIQTALAGAMAVPMAMIRDAVQALESLPRLAEVGNKNLVSDTGVAAVLLRACVQAAGLNVLINVTALADKALAESTRLEMDALIRQAEDLARRTLETVEGIILK